jgi:hypothetical protein
MWQNDQDQTEVLFRHLPSGTDKDEITLHSGQVVSGTKYEPEISGYEMNKTTAHSRKTFGMICYKILHVLSVKYLKDKANK